MDIVGFIFFAALTAVGGGTVRDLLLAADPIWTTLTCIAVTFGLRAWSLLFRWSLPINEARPPNS